MADTDTTPIAERRTESPLEEARTRSLKPDYQHPPTAKDKGEEKDKFKVSPLTTALIAGLVGIAGTFSGGILNLQVERQKQQGSLILEGIKTGDPKSAARNLLFFSEAKLISLSPQQIDALQKAAGDSILPVLPRPGNTTPQGVVFSPSDALTPDIKSSAEASLSKFQKYLSGVGFDLTGKKISVNIDPSIEANAFYTNNAGTYTLSLGPSAAKDETAILQQYALHILTTHRVDLQLETATVEQTNSLAALNLEWALADYLNCSYRNDPVVGRILGQKLGQPYLRNLDNKRKLSELSKAMSYQEAGEVWGGALWEIRGVLGRESADKVFFTVWSQLKRDDETQRIAQRILETVQSIEGKHTEEIRAVFIRRDLKL